MRQSMKDADGFSLVELMVAVLVVAIGLLGLAALQTTGLSGNHNAYLRTQATLLAQDMADRMMANRGGLTAYTGGVCNVPQPQTNPPSCTASQTAMAADDLLRWNQALQTQLPSSKGTVTLVAGGIYTITIQWVEHENNPSNNTNISVQKNYVMSFQP